MYKIKKLLIFLLAVIVFLDVGQGNIVDINASEVAEKNNDADNALWPIGPDIEADAAIVMDCDTGTVLYEKDAYTAYYPASITKVFTALLAVENCSLTETVTMSRDAETKVDGSRIGLVAGEQLSLKDALYGMLLESANEVAYAIGEHVSGSNMEAFAEMMKGRTSFIVAHRLSTIKEADVILVMKDGNIIEQGDHNSLMKAGGFYSNLYNSQFAVAQEA